MSFPPNLTKGEIYPSKSEYGWDDKDGGDERGVHASDTLLTETHVRAICEIT
jgi:hypothetical protein